MVDTSRKNKGWTKRTPIEKWRSGTPGGSIQEWKYIG